MSHKKLGSVKKKLRSAHYDSAELLGLIRFLMALLATSSGRKKLSKAQRRSLEATERQLVKRSKKHSRKRGKKQRTTTHRKCGRRSKSRTAHQKRFAALARKYHGRIPKGTKV